MLRSSRIPLYLALAWAVLLLAGAVSTAAQTTAPDNAPGKLVWSDEFNGPKGSAPDPAKWTVVEDGSGYGNNEQEYYTPRASNVHVADGNLVLTAFRENYSGKDGARKYTSGRLESHNKFNLQYGRVEARIKIPKGQGIWPAFWMLGSDYQTTGWPGCGEIDIMENIGAEPGMVHGSLHGPGYSGGVPLSATYALPAPAHFSDDFHVFAVDWRPGEMRFYVDGNLYETQKASNLSADKKWVFEHPFYVILNLAVGGYWPGMPDVATTFPQTMLVDYVRVYKLDNPQ